MMKEHAEKYAAAAIVALSIVGAVSSIVGACRREGIDPGGMVDCGHMCGLVGVKRFDRNGCECNDLLPGLRPPATPPAQHPAMAEAVDAAIRP